MQPTNVADPDYFHKVVDCQWACPAHTPVPEYIRLIAQGVMPTPTWSTGSRTCSRASSGRTCDRPCEPACRRGRVEEANAEQARAGRHLPAEARRRRQQGRHPARACRRRAASNGKRVACIGAGPASLTVARDLAPLGYEVTVFDGEAKAGGFMRTPDSALSAAGIGDRRGGRLHPATSASSSGRPAHRFDERAAGRRLRRRLRRLRRAARPRSAICPAAAKRPRTSISASTGWPRCRSAT